MVRFAVADDLALAQFDPDVGHHLVPVVAGGQRGAGPRGRGHRRLQGVGPGGRRGRLVDAVARGVGDGGPGDGDLLRRGRAGAGGRRRRGRGQRLGVGLPRTRRGQFHRPVGGGPCLAGRGEQAQGGGDHDSDEKSATAHAWALLVAVGRSPRGKGGDQLVQASVAGVVVEVAAPPVAVMPVREGMEK